MKHCRFHIIVCIAYLSDSYTKQEYDLVSHCLTVLMKDYINSERSKNRAIHLVQK